MSLFRLEHNRCCQSCITCSYDFFYPCNQIYTCSNSMFKLHSKRKVVKISGVYFIIMYLMKNLSFLSFQILKKIVANAISVLSLVYFFFQMLSKMTISEFAFPFYAYKIQLPWPLEVLVLKFCMYDPLKDL